MKIGELAEQTNLAPSRIRFYERIGLLKSVSREDNGYRTYPPEAVTFLRLITSAQQVGFSLDEIKLLLPTDLSKWDHSTFVTAMQNKINQIEEMTKRLLESKQQLQAVLDQIDQKSTDMDCPKNAIRVLKHFGMSLDQ